MGGHNSLGRNNCVEQMENSDGIEETRQNIMIDESKISLNQSSIIKNDDSLIIFDDNHCYCYDCN